MFFKSQKLKCGVKSLNSCPIQGMNMIAGMLLFHLEEEAAFWGLVAILEMIMPSGYYNTDLLAARADQIIFQVYFPLYFSHSHN